MNDPHNIQQSHRTDPIMSEEAEREFLPIIDVFVILSNRLRFIFMAILGFFLAGLILALTGPSQYTSSALVIREVQSSSTSSPLSALRGLGFGSLGSTTGLNPETIPDILLTREVMLAVARDSYHFDDIDSTVSFLAYLDITDRFSFEDFVKLVKRYTIRLPNTIVKGVKGKQKINYASLNKNQAFITSQEKLALKELEKMLNLSVDQVSGIMDIQVTTDNPIMSATLAGSFIKHLTERVREIYTQKSRDQVTFIRARVDETEAELLKAENDLVKFIDSNLGPSEERLRIEIDRLTRKVRFKEQLYQDLQSQLTQAELELQRADPVLTVLERPVPPLDPSASDTAKTIFIFTMLGLIFAPGYVLLTDRLNYMRSTGDNQGKFATIEGNFRALFTSLRTLVSRSKAKPE